jgi:hypothetical protein
MTSSLFTSIAALTLAFQVPLEPVPSAPSKVKTDLSFDSVIALVEGMVSDPAANQLVANAGLDLVNVMWEDTGRLYGSSVGPNISDLTIGVRDSRGALHPMPVMRFNNFTDVTADVSASQVGVSVGNESGDALHNISLEELLRNTRDYLHDDGSWVGKDSSLWDDRDTHVLVSAQAAFLPIPADGDALFTPVIYNYQSSLGSPAVLTIVATSEGTSIQVVENSSGYMSDTLFFNDNGERAPYTATRLSTHNREQVATGGAVASEDDGLDMVMIIQVPLVVERSSNWFELGAGGFGMGGLGMGGGGASMASPAMPEAQMDAGRSSDVETAVIGHGEAEGPFSEINGNSIQRDADYPIRVTVQFYKATSNGVVSQQDVDDVRAQIDRVYESGDYIGSLVTGGPTGRPTSWIEELDSPRWAPGVFNALKWQ